MTEVFPPRKYDPNRLIDHVYCEDCPGCDTGRNTARCEKCECWDCEDEKWEERQAVAVYRKYSNA